MKAVACGTCFNVVHRIMIFEEIIADPLVTMKIIFIFLGVDLVDCDGREEVSLTQVTISPPYVYYR